MAFLFMPFSQISAFSSVESRAGNTKNPIGINRGNQQTSYVDGEVLVKYKNSKINLQTASGRVTANSFNRSKSLAHKEYLEKSNISLLKISDGKSVEEKITELKNNPNVDYTQPNYKKYPATISTNDPDRGLLWGLDNIADKDIDAPEAWAVNEGTNGTVIVAVIDTGVAYNHPDLSANMWDGTSCKDENGGSLGGCNHGYDYEDNDTTPLPTASSHGTHIAGTIGAVKNNGTGIVGVAPNVEIMAIKFEFDTISEVKSIDFAIQNGAKVINASFAGGSYDSAEYNAIDRFKSAGGILVAGAGNDGLNNESTPSYPSDYDLDNIISVAATDRNDGLASFSNYGVTSVDVGAPGTDIYSTIAGTISSEETFEGISPPSMPGGWTRGGTSNNWGTYNLGGDWGKVLYGDLAQLYAGDVDTTVTSSAYDLSDAGTGTTFDFWSQCDTEYMPGTGWADYMQLEYSADGVNFLPAVDPFSGEEFRWDEAAFDIYNSGDYSDGSGSASFHYDNIAIPDEYLTGNFKFRFRWVTNGSDNNYDGCLVDDIKITRYSDGSDEGYDYMSGTSMATPHVAGLVALVEGYKPALTYTQVRNIVLGSGDDISALHGKTSSGRRINAKNALDAASLFGVPSSSVYALRNQKTGVYLYTTSLNSYNYLGSHGWSKKGIAYKSFKTPRTGLGPIYYLKSKTTGAYYYTKSSTYYNYLGSHGWSKKGIAFYAYSFSQYNSTPIYSLKSKTTGAYYYTKSSTYYNYLGSHGWSKKGISFYSPK